MTTQTPRLEVGRLKSSTPSRTQQGTILSFEAQFHTRLSALYGHAKAVGHQHSYHKTHHDGI